MVPGVLNKVEVIIFVIAVTINHHLLKTEASKLYVLSYPRALRFALYHKDVWNALTLLG